LGGGALVEPAVASSPLLSLSLMVEHLKVLRVEHLKVLSLTVEHACASLTVEHLKVLISRAPCRVLARCGQVGKPCPRRDKRLRTFNLLIGWGGLMVERPYGSLLSDFQPSAEQTVQCLTVLHSICFQFLYDRLPHLVLWLSGACTSMKAYPQAGGLFSLLQLEQIEACYWNHVFQQHHFWHLSPKWLPSL